MTDNSNSKPLPPVCRYSTKKGTYLECTMFGGKGCADFLASVENQADGLGWCKHISRLHLVPLTETGILQVPIFAEPRVFACLRMERAADDYILASTDEGGGQGVEVGLLHKSETWRDLRTLYLDLLSQVRHNPKTKWECFSTLHRDTGFASDWANPTTASIQELLTDAHFLITKNMCASCATTHASFVPDV